MKALWNNEILASSDKTIIVEGNHYFPPSSLKMEFFIGPEKQLPALGKGLLITTTSP